MERHIASLVIGPITIEIEGRPNSMLHRRNNSRLRPVAARAWRREGTFVTIDDVVEHAEGFIEIKCVDVLCVVMYHCLSLVQTQETRP